MVGAKRVKLVTMKDKIYIRTVYVNRKGEYINFSHGLSKTNRLYLVKYDKGIPMIISYDWIKSIHTIDPRVNKWIKKQQNVGIVLLWLEIVSFVQKIVSLIGIG